MTNDFIIVRSTRTKSTSGHLDSRGCITGLQCTVYCIHCRQVPWHITSRASYPMPSCRTSLYHLQNSTMGITSLMTDNSYYKLTESAPALIIDYQNHDRNPYYITNHQNHQSHKPNYHQSCHYRIQLLHVSS